MRFLAALFLAALGSSPLSAQNVVSSLSSANGSTNGTIRMSPRRFSGVPVTGAPYSAQRLNEHVQIAADGELKLTRHPEMRTVSAARIKEVSLTAKLKAAGA